MTTEQIIRAEIIAESPDMDQAAIAGEILSRLNQANRQKLTPREIEVLANVQYYADKGTEFAPYAYEALICKRLLIKGAIKRATWGYVPA